MSLFSNFEGIINACDSYEKIIKKATDETKQDEASMFQAMLGTVKLADINARRFLDQFGQFDAYTNGDIYAVLPREVLEEQIVSKSNFTVLQQYKDSVTGKFNVVIKFAPGTKYPIVMVRNAASNRDVETIKKFRKTEEVLDHLIPLIKAVNKKGQPIIPALRAVVTRKTPEDIEREESLAKQDKMVASTFNSAPVKLKAGAYKVLRDYVVKHHEPQPNDDRIMISLEDGGSVSKKELRDHIRALYQLLIDTTKDANSNEENDKLRYTYFDTLVSNAYSFYADQNYYKSLADEIEELAGNNPVVNIEPEEKQQADELANVIKEAINEGTEEKRIDFTSRFQIQKYIANLSLSDELSGPQKSILAMYRKMGTNKFYETMLRIEEGTYRIPTTQAKFIDRAFINIPDSSGKKLAAKIRERILKSFEGKNVDAIQIEAKVRASLAEAVKAQITDIDVRPTSHMGDISFASFGQNKNLFPAGAELAPSFPVDEYFSDPETIKEFSEVIPNEPSYARIVRQSAIIEKEITKFKNNIDKSRIVNLTKMIDLIRDNKEEELSNFDKSVFTDKVRAIKFERYLKETYVGDDDQSTSNKAVDLDAVNPTQDIGNVEVNEEATQPDINVGELTSIQQSKLTYNEFILKKRAILAGILQKELAVAKNTDKVMKLLELRKMIDPASPMFWMAEIYNNVEKALKVTALSGYLQSSLLHPLRMKPLDFYSLPQEMQSQFSAIEWDKKKNESIISEESEYRPEKVYGHEYIEKPSQKDEESFSAPTFYLMDRSHYDILKHLTSSIGKKYKRILNDVAGKFTGARNQVKKLNSYSQSQMIVAYSLVCGYFNFDFDLNNGYKNFLRIDYMRKLDAGQTEIEKVDEVLKNTNKEENLLNNRFDSVPAYKIYHEHILVPPDVKYWVDTMIAFGYNENETIPRQKTPEEIDEHNKKITELNSKLEEMKNKGESDDDIEEYKTHVLDSLEYHFDKDSKSWDNLSDFVLENEVAPNPDDNYWERFKELRETYTGFMSKLEKSGYQYNVSIEDPIAQQEIETEEKHSGVVSGQRGTGTFTLEKNRPNDTRQYFPTQWEPIVTVYSVDDDGNPVHDANGNKIVLGAYSTFDEKFWQTLMSMNRNNRQPILEQAKQTTEKLTAFTQLDDAGEYGKALLNRTNKELSYEDWKREHSEILLNKYGPETVNEFLENEARQPSKGPHKRVWDTDNNTSTQIPNLTFNEVFNESLTGYLEKVHDFKPAMQTIENITNNNEVILINAEIEKIVEEKNLITSRLKNTKKGDWEQNALKVNKVKDLEQQRVELNDNIKNLKQKKQNILKNNNTTEITTNSINEQYAILAESRLPNAITNAIMRYLISQSAILKEIVIDNSELRTYMLNKIKNFVNIWLDENKNSNEYKKALNNLIIFNDSNTHYLYTFSIASIYQSFIKMYSNIPFDSNNSVKDSKQLENTRTELQKRRLIYYMMNTDERSKEGIDIGVYYDKDFVDTMLQNVVNETYKIDEMMRKFAKIELIHVEQSTYEYDPEDIIVLLTNKFLDAIRKGGELYDEFIGYSVNASQLVKDENKSYNYQRDFSYTPDENLSDYVEGPFRSYVIERMTEFVDNYVETSGSEDAIVNNPEKWDESFSSKKEKGIVQYIYNLVQEPFSVFEDMSKQYLMKEPKDDKDNITGRIALLLNARRSGVVIETHLEKMLNLVVGEVHKLDTMVFEKYTEEMSNERAKQNQNDEIVEQGQIVSINYDSIKNAISQYISSSEELSSIKRLITIMHESASNRIDPTDSGYNKFEGNTDAVSAVQGLIFNYINARVDELIYSERDGDSYVFDSNSTVVIDTIMKLIPLREFARYDYTENEVKEMVVQSVESNSFNKYDYKNRNFYRISERRFIKNIETNKQRINKITEDAIESDMKKLIRSFVVLESSLIKCLSATQHEFVNNDGEVDYKDYPNWINKAYGMFVTAPSKMVAKSKKINDGEVEPSEGVVDLDEVSPLTEEMRKIQNTNDFYSTKSKVNEKVINNSKEFNSLLGKLGIKNDSDAIESMKSFIKDNLIPKLLERKKTPYKGALKITVRPDDGKFIELMMSILKSRYGKELVYAGYTDDKLIHLIQVYMTDSIVSRSQSTVEGAQLKGMINEMENPVDMSFSLNSYDDITTYGTMTSEYVVSLMEKQINKEIWNIVTTLIDKNITNLNDVQERVSDPAMKEFILKTYNNDGIARLVQLGQLIAGSTVYSAEEENYYVKMKAYKKGNVKYQEVDGPLQDAQVYDGKMLWKRDKKFQPIIELNWKPDVYDVKDEQGNPVVDPNTGLPKLDVKLRGYIEDEDQLNSEVGDNKETDFIYETMSKWTNSSNTNVLNNKGVVVTLGDFFGKQGVDGKSLECGLYRATVVSKSNLATLKELLRAAIYQDRVLDYVSKDNTENEMAKINTQYDVKQHYLSQIMKDNEGEIYAKNNVNDEGVPDHSENVRVDNFENKGNVDAVSIDMNLGDIMHQQAPNNIHSQQYFLGQFDSDVDEYTDLEAVEKSKDQPIYEPVDLELANTSKKTKKPSKSKPKATKEVAEDTFTSFKPKDSNQPPMVEEQDLGEIENLNEPVDLDELKRTL